MSTGRSADGDRAAARPQAEGQLGRWKPVPLGPDADRLAALARAMPPAGRALSRNGDAPPQHPAAAVLGATLDALTDHLVRSALQAAPVAPARGRRKKAAV